MTHARQTSRRGAVLIVVLIVLSGLSLLAVSVSHRSGLETRMARWQHEQAYVRELAHGALVIAIDRLEQDKNPIDSPADPWHAKLSCDNLRWLPGASARYAVSQRVQVTCTDEESRLNLNRATPEMLDRLRLPAALRAAIKDWGDDDEEITRDGAESGYYLALPAPYHAKNKPLERISELLLIKGVDTAAYQGSGAGPTRQAGLRDLLTVCGAGRINVNTASVAVLKAIPGLTDPVVRKIVAVRDGPDAAPGTQDDHAYESLSDVVKLCTLTEFEGDLLTRFAQCHSEYFRLEAYASVDDGRVACRIEMLVHRVGGKVLPIISHESTYE